jgi:hypothetical protein
MNIRREPTYLSFETYRALRLLAKSRTSEGHIVTADQLADEMLAETIVAKFPMLVEHLKKIEKLERDFVKTLQ